MFASLRGFSVIDSGVSTFLFEVSRFPGLIEKSLLRRVESEDHEIALAGDRSKPVLLFASGCVRAEVKIEGAIGVLHRLIHLVQRRVRLSAIQARCCGRVIYRSRPEVLRGDVRRQM